jgi:hypothetical protein
MYVDYLSGGVFIAYDLHCGPSSTELLTASPHVVRFVSPDVSYRTETLLRRLHRHSTPLETFPIRPSHSVSCISHLRNPSLLTVQAAW